ncbi:MAG: NAD(P)/FAD-dependent oxidoreductase [Clostridiaceae bacterium]|nr:NAD(P)/FAD-dependent oxidoreductase [Clostridiaceae bacterium]
MADNKVIVVGGGAAGMIAAISAQRAGANVTILERNPRVGKKILATGNGRCNFTNINTDINCYNGNNPEFVRGALSAFTVNDTIRFFERLGIEHKVEDMGKVFPMSDQASSILDVLLYEINDKKINVVCNCHVTDIAKKGNKFSVSAEKGENYTANSVIIAAGGKAMPSTGSDGNGYDLAKKLGHRITNIFPALVQIMLEGSFFKRIEGVKFVGTAEIIHNNKSVAKDRGDILFGNYGVSGPPILQISRKAGELHQAGKEAYIKITIMDMPEEGLRNILNRRFEELQSKPLDFSFVGFINKRLIPVILLEAGIENIKKLVSELSEKEKENIIRILTDWRMKIRGTKSWPSAQVTAGGVDTKDIDENSMESKLVKGLFFAGEIIDIDGQCGGFNLQWAWSSGYIAGKNAALRRIS